MENQTEDNGYGNKGLLIMGIILIAAFVAAKVMWDFFVSQ